MTFVRQALSLFLQSGGMVALIGRARVRIARDIRGLEPLRSAVLMVQFTTAIIALHVLQILLWTCFYRRSCFSLWDLAFYFSTVSYTTAGSGGVLLLRMWRTLGPVEGVVGILMFGLSASFLFAIVTRLVGSHPQLSTQLP